ncbi:MAG: 2-isopropylmalate synthase [Elusimicrobiota bacterium]|jgi:isopropylmalate/homocitrate/citramalate synthase|nr:2-isopropylmalate synthase [Elusimicrobiota bacterium]
MLKFNKKNNKLEFESYVFNLQDVKEPNLFRETFQYNEVPKIPFNGEVVPMTTPSEIWITDTSFRDGQQAFNPFSVKQIVDIYTFLHKLGGPKGVIRQSEFFLYSDKDKEAVRKCQELGFDFPQITAWIRATKADFKLVKEMGLKETGILTSASDYHIFLKLKKTRKEAMEMYLDIVKAALEAGIIPRCHLEDITRADFYGFVVPFAVELMKLSKESGIPIKLRACDTLGLGVSYPGASMPRNVNGIMHGFIHYAGVPSEYLEWHAHNDFYRGLTNSTSCWLYGCCAINGTVLGIGERTGNIPLEALAMEYAAFRGTSDGMDLSVITDIADYFRKEIHFDIPKNQPFVGAHCNMTKAGIHADGLLKEPEIYSSFDTQAILKRPLEVEITDRAGLAGIAYWYNSNLEKLVNSDTKLDKNDAAVIAIKEEVDAIFQHGRVSAMSEEELLSLAKRYIPQFLQDKK